MKSFCKRFRFTRRVYFTIEKYIMRLLRIKKYYRKEDGKRWMLSCKGWKDMNDKCRRRKLNRDDKRIYGSGYLSNKQNKKKRLVERDGSLCQMCFRRMHPGQLSIDHIQRRADGGSNTLDNLQLLCHPCHRIKDHPKHPGISKEKSPTRWTF